MVSFVLVVLDVEVLRIPDQVSILFTQNKPDVEHIFVFCISFVKFEPTEVWCQV